MAKIRPFILAAGLAAATGLAGPVAMVAAAAPAAAITRPAVPRVSGPFHIGPSNSAGTVALTANGSRVVVYDIASGHGKTKVCLISPSGRSCGHSVLLSPPASSDNTFSRPGVFVPSANHVDVLQRTCCEVNVNSTVLYRSTNGGKTFSAPVRVGAIGTDASELIGSNIVFTEQNSAAGLRVVSIPLSVSAPAATATISTRVAYDVGLGQYKGGALIGTDFLGKTSTTTYVYFAPKGNNFDSAASYHLTGTLKGETLVAMSGAALLTSNKSDKLLLRMFTGKSFGPARVVAHLHGGLGTWITVDQDPSGHVHVFAVLASASYQMLEVSTSNGGKAWTRAARLGNGISSTVLSAAVNSHNVGLVLGTSPAIGYPVP